MDVQSRERSTSHGERRSWRLSSQYLPNAACRGSISCVALRSFDAFLVLQNAGRAALPPPLLDFVEVAKLFHEVPRGPSVSQTVCHHSKLAATEFFENGLHFACDLVRGGRDLDAPQSGLERVDPSVAGPVCRGSPGRRKCGFYLGCHFLPLE